MRELILAVDESGAIGSKGKLGFHCKHDMRWFSYFTQNKILYAGRVTYELIKHLDNRIVRLATREIPPPHGCYVGGSEVVNSVMGYLDQAYITHLKQKISEPDRFICLDSIYKQLPKHEVIIDESWGIVMRYSRIYDMER